MSKDTKWKVAIYGLSICILSLCFVVVRVSNSGHQGLALVLVSGLIVASFFDIYLMCKREDMIAKSEGCNLPCVQTNNQVHIEIMDALTKITNK